MKKFIYIAIAALAFNLTSCVFEEKSYFDQSAAERVSASIKNAQDVLTGSASGWVMQMYPEATQAYGAFNVLCKFNLDGTVEVAGEIAEPEEVVKSYYRLDQSAGVVLSFDLYNDIFHYFSDPSVTTGGGAGYGLEGDYDYLVINATPEKVILKGKKSGNYSVMYPVPTGVTWAEFINGILDMEEQVCGFSKYNMTVGDSTVVASLTSYRKFTYDTIVDGKPLEVNAPFCLTLEGFTLYQPIEIYGKTIEGFVVKGEDLVCVNDESVVMRPFIPPINETFATGDWFMKQSNMSASMLAEFNKFTSGVKSGEGETVVYFAMCVGSHMLSSYAANWGLFMYVDTGYAAQWTCTPSFEGEDKITLTFDGSGQGDANYYLRYGETHLNALSKTFVVTADNLRAPKEITLTDTANKDNWIKFVGDMVQY